MDKKRSLPPTYFLGAIVLMLVLHFILPIRQLIVAPWRWLALIPVVFGILIELVADRAFKQAQTTVKPFETSTVLVTAGVFRVTRNPMYLGMIFMLLGGWILLGSESSFLPIPMLAILLDRIFIRPEEAMLRETFGEQYDAYWRNTRRWI